MAGGGQFDTTFLDISRTFKRVKVQFWNFLTFPKYQKQKFWTQFEFKFFNPTPSWRGGIKIEVHEILVGDPMLLNIIFKANKNKNKSKSWALYLKNWASYGDFRESSRAKSQILKKFKSQNLAQFLRLGSEFWHVISIFIYLYRSKL